MIERAVRQGMAREKIEDLPLFPEGRPTAAPTCPRILEAFRSVSWHEFRRGDIVRFPIELTPLQKLLLRLLEVPLDLVYIGIVRCRHRPFDFAEAAG